MGWIIRKNKRSTTTTTTNTTLAGQGRVEVEVEVLQTPPLPLPPMKYWAGMVGQAQFWSKGFELKSFPVKKMSDANLLARASVRVREGDD